MYRLLSTLSFLSLTQISCNTLFHSLSRHSSNTSSSNGPTITTQYGTLQGVYQFNGTVEYYGDVPYAEPPVNASRFRYPVDWSAPYTQQPYNATTRVSDCLSLSTTLGGVEDCLYIDIWKPTTPAPATGYPVLMFFPGGGFVFTGYQNMSQLIADGANVITIYVRSRVGPFGFLAHPGYSAETSPIESSGMYGIADLISSMRWVNENIHSFNGNNQSVTISGESAGSISVCYILNSPLASGLFHGAVLMSGGCDEVSGRLDDQELIGYNMAQQSSCAINSTNSTGAPTPAELAQQAACYRNLTSEEIWSSYLSINPVNTSSAFTFSPNISRPFSDGYVVPLLPTTGWSTGQFNRVPIITGDCNDEGGLWSAIDPTWQPPIINFTLPETYALPYVENPLSPIYNAYNTSTTPAELYYGPTGPFAQYAASINQSASVGAYLAQADLITTSVFACAVRRQARAYNTYSKSWTYDFKHVWSTDLFVTVGAVHASDLPFWFGDAVDGSYTGLDSFTPGQNVLSASMQQYFINFVVNHDPNNSTNVNITDSNIVAWPEYNATAGIYLDFGNGTVNNTILQNDIEPFNNSCAIWDLYTPVGNTTIRCAAGYTLNTSATAWNSSGKCISTAIGLAPQTGLFNTSSNGYYGAGGEGASTSTSNSTSYYGPGSGESTGTPATSTTESSSASTPEDSSQSTAATPAAGSKH